MEDCLLPTCSRPRLGYFGIYLCSEHAFRMHAKIKAYIADPGDADEDGIWRALAQIDGQRDLPRRGEYAFLQNIDTKGPTRNVPSPDPRYTTGPGFIYFIRLCDRVKIGFSRDVSRRLSELPWDEVLGVVEGTMQHERVAHKMWAHLHFRGEWFYDHPDLRAWIDTLGLVEPVSGETTWASAPRASHD